MTDHCSRDDTPVPQELDQSHLNGGADRLAEIRFVNSGCPLILPELIHERPTAAKSNEICICGSETVGVYFMSPQFSSHSIVLGSLAGEDEANAGNLG